MRAAAERAARSDNAGATLLLRRATDLARPFAKQASDAAALNRLVSDRQRLDRRIDDLRTKTGTAATPGGDPAADARELACLLLAARIPPQPDKAGDSLSQGDASVKQLATAWATPWSVSGESAADVAGQLATAASGRMAAPLQLALLDSSAAWYAAALATYTLPQNRREPFLAELVKTESRLEQLAVDAKLDSSMPVVASRFHNSANLLSAALPPTGLPGFGSGVWTRQDRLLTADAAAGRATCLIPIAPVGSYEVSIDFAATGSSGVGVVLPVGDAPICISRSGTGVAVGLIDGTVKSFDAKLPDAAKDYVRHKLVVWISASDEKAMLLLQLDGVELVRWQGLRTALTDSGEVAMSDPRCLALTVRDGQATFHGATIRSVVGSLEQIDPPVPSEFPLDGTRPADAVLQKPGPTQTVASHNLVSLNVDTARRTNPIQLSFAEPTELAARTRAGFTRMMSNVGNLAPLRIDGNRYRRLLAMLQEAPRGYTNADLARLADLVRQLDAAPRRGSPAAGRARSAAPFAPSRRSLPRFGNRLDNGHPEKPFPSRA